MRALERSLRKVLSVSKRGQESVFLDRMLLRSIPYCCGTILAEVGGGAFVGRYNFLCLWGHYPG